MRDCFIHSTVRQYFHNWLLSGQWLLQQVGQSLESWVSHITFIGNPEWPRLGEHQLQSSSVRSHPATVSRISVCVILPKRQPLYERHADVFSMEICIQMTSATTRLLPELWNSCYKRGKPSRTDPWWITSSTETALDSCEWAIPITLGVQSCLVLTRCEALRIFWRASVYNFIEAGPDYMQSPNERRFGKYRYEL